MKGFLPGRSGNGEVEREDREQPADIVPGGKVAGPAAEKPDIMSAALLVLTILTILIGLWPGPLIRYAADIAAAVL